MKRKQSKHNQIKAHLESGRAISRLDAKMWYRVSYLASVIHRLRKKGLKIYTHKGLKYAFYSIID